MKFFAKYFLGTILLLVLLVGIDQFLLRVPMEQPFVVPLQRFYVDFRSRLLHLGGSAPYRQEPVPVRQAQTPAPVKPATKPAKEGVVLDQVLEKALDEATSAAKAAGSGIPSYLYVDTDGALHFAASLEEIPPALRSTAQKLSP